MLRAITSAPVLVMREIGSLAHVRISDAAEIDAPAWAETLIESEDESAFANVMRYLLTMRERIDAWHPRPAIADPTYAIAAARIEREGGQGSPAPATIRAR